MVAKISKIGPQPTNIKRRKGKNGERITVAKIIFMWKNPRTGHGEKRGCTSLQEKGCSGVVTGGVVTSDWEFDCFSLFVGGEGVFIQVER